MQVNRLKISILIMALIGFSSSGSWAQQLDPELKELISKGLHKSHSIQIYKMEAEQAQVDQKLAKSTFLPHVTVNGSYTRLNDDITFDQNTQNLLVATQKLLIKEAAGIPFHAPFPENIPLTEVANLQDKNILKSSVDVDWVLFSGMEATNALKASKHQEASLDYLGKAEEDKLALQIIEAYDKLALVHASRQVITTSEKFLNEQAHYVNKAIKNGLATPLSRKKIELAQQQLASKELELRQNTTLLIEVLQQLTGETRANLAQLEPRMVAPSHVALSGQEKRHEVKALEEAEKATVYKAKMDKSSFIPKVALQGHYEYLEDNLSLLEPKWYVGVGVKWNLYDGNRARIKSQKSNIESRKFRAKINQAEEMIELSVVQAQLNYESALQKTQIAQKEIDLAQATYDMVDKQHKNNLASINEVLDALTDLEKANFKLQETYFHQRRAMTELLHAKGTLTSYYN